MEEVCPPRTRSIPETASALKTLVVGALSVFILCAAVTWAAGGTGRIAVQTAPAGANVFIDGQPSGKSPAALEGLAPGRYFVRVELDGYRPAELVVNLGAGQKYQSPALELISQSAPPPRAAAAPAPAAPPMPAPASAKPLESGFPAASDTVVTAKPPTAAPVAPPAPAPAPAAPETAAGGDDAPVQAAVNDYLSAIADSDVDAYTQLCAPSVEFYEDGTKTPAAIRKIRQQFKDRWPVYKIENVRDGSVRAGDKPGVKRATVTYDWSVSNPKTGKSAKGTATDQLDFRETKGKWLIVRTRQVVDRGRR